MKISTKILLLFFAILLSASSSYAASYIMDLQGSYGNATHSNPNWQNLATATSDYGVFWSVNGGSLGHDDLYVGDTVQFLISMHKNYLGTHYEDLSKTWIDWDQNGTFDSDEVIEYGTHIVKANQTATVTADSTKTVNEYYTFLSSTYTITDAEIGDLFLRSRVTCSESLTGSLGGGWNDQWKAQYTSQFENKFNPTGNYGQGEVEEWDIKVNPKSAPTPEPSTILLFGSGIFGFLGMKRKKK